ncbi:S8 family serine peptidase [Streptomyces sp. SID13031]|uniref:S8 family peptidase n=1 Tax=Streptomyces sp. SID13031 TaxID=2706046 RepID=UPI0013CCA885|nr:S8 family serine peptidase [Streptomyces sp. SID13031]NEA34684.1 S8 family serine peptidase [Streptomyces sp. SID13031]
MSRSKKLAAATALSLAAIAALAVPAAGLQSPPPTSLPSAGTDGADAGPAGTSVAPLTITLVTGDKVTVRRTAGGYVPVNVQPGSGRETMAFHKVSFKDKQLVVPLDAFALVTSGVVDERLFDVSLLANLGLDDKSSPRLPLLVQYAAGGAARTVRSALPEGTTVKRELPIIDAVAIGQERSQAGDLWFNWLNSPQARRKTGLAGSVKKVWLDGGVTPNVDRSVPQIGAPAAWQAGFTGKGVKVAVLDSGYDATHPDFKGRVIATKGFTADDEGHVDENDVVDRVGHGTHTASTVAGTGAASDGKYKGVAPDADLMIGKVCGDRNCESSAMIAGMQWAAGSGARVVNMSIGGGPTDGTDILSETVNELTASTGTLFVISAGNFGAEQSVSTPAAADAALAVASVTKSDTHSDFSSQGPRVGDLSVKPEISAPGSKIVAARAANTPLAPFAINDSYAELSGTSMAAPHVTGAAALIAQQHPDWKAPELKSALMGSSLELGGQGIYTQGAGRVDVAQAIKQQVLAMPSNLNLGLQAAPHNDDKPVTKPVTYVNKGNRPVRLTLRLEGAKLFRLDRTAVTVPANGSAIVNVTATTSGPEAEGAYAAWLVASGNGSTIRSTIGVGKEVSTYSHTLQMTDRTGAPATNDDLHLAGTYLIDVERRQAYSVAAGQTVKLPAGHYLVDGYAATLRSGAPGFQEITYYTEGDLVIGKTGPVVLDGRRAAKVAFKAPVTGATAATGGIGMNRTLATGTYVGGVGLDGSGVPNAEPELYVVPNKTGTAKNYTAYAHVAWAGAPDGPVPGVGSFLNSPYLYHDVSVWPGRIPAHPSVITNPRDFAHIDASYAGEPGFYADNYGFPTDPHPAADGTRLPLFVFTPTISMSLPFRRDEYYSTKGVAWAFSNEVFSFSEENGYEYHSLVDSEVYNFRAGKTTKLDWERGVFGPSLPDPRIGNPGRPALPWVARDGDSLSVYVPTFSDGAPSRLGDVSSTSEQTTLFRNGQQLGSSDSVAIQTFALPADEATYRLAKVVKPGAVWTKLSTEISSEWTFRSKRTPDGVDTALPLLNVRYTPPLDDRNRAAGGKFEFPVTVQTAFLAPAKPIVSLQVSASFDDGGSWHQVPVRRAGINTFKATVDQPSSGFVTLRSVAIDAAGNKVTQTIKRAYELR